jgi:hypothetical protein
MEASCPSCFTPGERAPGTHWIGGWVGLRAILGTVEKREILHCRESNLGHSAYSPSYAKVKNSGAIPPFPNMSYGIVHNHLFFTLV